MTELSPDAQRIVAAVEAVLKSSERHNSLVETIQLRRRIRKAVGAATEPTPTKRPRVDCDWSRCKGSPNPCLAWCKCRCHQTGVVSSRATEATP